MTFNRKHTQYCILFAFQLKKNAVEIICRAFIEDAMIVQLAKRYKKFRVGDFSLGDKESSGQSQKF